MYKVFIIGATIAFSFLCCDAQAQKLTFSYDASGNQTERRWVCVNCRPAQGLSVTKSSGQVAMINNAEDQGLNIKSLKVFPNPVSERVSVIWSLPDKTYIRSMDIFNVGGNRVFSGAYKADERETQIAMDRLPPGTYVLVIRYSDNQTESIKLIKI